MSVRSVEPLIKATRALELSTQHRANDELSNFIAASTSLRMMRRQKLSPSFRIVPRKMRGPRLDVSRSRYGSSVTTAFWPQDGLEAKRFPILCGVLEGEAALPMEEYCLHADAGSLVFIPTAVAHPDGSEAHVNSKNEKDYCDLLWLYRWEGGLVCHICHSRGTLHTNFHARENCFIIGPRSIFFFDLLAETVSAHQQAHQLNKTAGEASTIDAVALPYLLPALLAVVGADLRAGHFVQPGVLLDGIQGANEADNTQERDMKKAANWAEPAQWKEDYGAMTQVQSYVLFNLDQPLSIDRMAQMMFMSRAQFTRRFRLASGHSFVDWVTNVRLESAKLYLTETDWSVEIIASAVGVRPSHLWDLFARRLNITPGEFRRQARQKEGSRAGLSKIGISHKK